MSLASIVPAKEIWPDQEVSWEALADLLGGIDRESALLQVGYCQMILTGLAERPAVGSRPPYESVLGRYLDDPASKRVHSYLSSAEKDGRMALPVGRRQLLGLYSAVCALCPDHEQGSDFDDPVVKERFARAIFVASELVVNALADHLTSVGEGAASMSAVERVVHLLPLADSGLTADRLIYFVDRALQTFDPRHPLVSQEFLHEFRRCFGFPAEVALQLQLALFMVYRYSPSRSPVLRMDGFLEDVPDRDQVLAALEPYLHRPDEVVPPDDTKPSGINDGAWWFRSWKRILNAPLLRTRRGNLVPADPFFLAQRFGYGLVFQASQKCPDYTHWLAEYGRAFETYVQNALQQHFGRAGISPLGRAWFNQRILGKLPTEVDAIIEHRTFLYLVQVKTLWLNEEKLLASSREEAREYLEGRLKVQREAGEGLTIIGQMARTIRGILDRNVESSLRPVVERLSTVVPVWVVADPKVSVPWMTATFTDWLLEELSDARAAGSRYNLGGGQFIKPIVWTAEDLELVCGALNRVDLDTLVAAYDTSVPDRVETWWNWLAGSEYRQHVFMNPATRQRVEDAADDLLKAWTQ